MIFFYRILTLILFPFFVAVIYLRRFKNKEDKIRFKEKIFITKPNFPNKKKVIWIHAASVGETNSVIPLIKELIERNKQIFVLLTTSTFTSSQLIKKKELSSENFQHNFFPLDVQFLVKKFLNYWRPKLVIFIDSEVWPNYLLEISKREIPLMLLNGRISMKTFKRWKIIPNLSKKLFSLYDLCLASSKESEKNLKELGVRKVKFIGNLKFCAVIKDEKGNGVIKSIPNDVYVWCAASTHPGEEEMILKTHSLLKQKGLNIITIIIPRHINRSPKILAICNYVKLKSQIIRSHSEILKGTEILIINSIGEMSKYFFACRSIFMGKSFSEKLIKVGGQNPIEAAKCGCKIYHGPYVSNFKEIYSYLNEKKIAFEVTNENDLADNLLKDIGEVENFNKKNIQDLNSFGDKILNLITEEVLRLTK